MLPLLQAAQQGGSQWFTLVLFGGMFVVMYFFMIRPQQKKAKEAKNFRENIKKGDEVVTIGGLHGKVHSVKDNGTIVLEADPGVRLTFSLESISAESTKKIMETELKKS
ncbi:MAG: preprotein translocase subunit YajC [Cytophagaceae bacterium]|jgi:preprotein translocase subunit YajC|nr:preprotein translocase subunit YajC [Cytophagaceae bacterium]